MKLSVCDLSKCGELGEDDDGAAVVSSTSWKKQRKKTTVGSHLNVEENMQECCMDNMGLFFLNQRVSDEESVVIELKIAQGHKLGG